MNNISKMQATAAAQTDPIARSTIEADRVLMTRVGLQIPRDLSFEDWERAGCQLSGIVDSSSWWLGDWLVYGKKHYSDRYRRALRTAGLSYQTLRNYAWVARRFEIGRRRPRLSFQHHAEVASLTVDEQDFWLGQAEQKMWTTKQLRTHVRIGKGDNNVYEVERATVIPRIAVPDYRLGRWRRAADHTGIDFENWVLTTLDGAAEQALGEMLDTEAA